MLCERYLEGHGGDVQGHPTSPQRTLPEELPHTDHQTHSTRHVHSGDR